MINQTFDFIWNGFGNKEFIDNETFHLKRTTKQTHPLARTPLLNGENKMTDITTENRTTKRISKNIAKRERNNRAYAIYAVLT